MITTVKQIEEGYDPDRIGWFFPIFRKYGRLLLIVRKYTEN